MRTTLSIDPDVLSAARQLAAQQSRSIGAVISDLARKGLQAAQRGRFPIFEVSADAQPVTIDDIKHADGEW